MYLSKKTYLRIFAASLILACVVSLPLAPVGCAKGVKTTYQASSATHITATTALRGWNEYLVVKDRELEALALTNPERALSQRNGISQQVVQVKSAYEKYQASQLVLLTAAQQFNKVPTGTNAPSSQVTLDAAVAAASATLLELINLVQTFGVKL